MPVNLRARDLIDWATNIQGALASPNVVAPGTIVSPVILTRGGITTLGVTYAFPSVAKGTTWFAIGDGDGTFSVGDTGCWHETGRAPVLPLLDLGGLVLAAALLPAIAGLGVVNEVALMGPASPGHSAASQVANSGTCYAHIKLGQPLLKHCLKSILVEWAQN